MRRVCFLFLLLSFIPVTAMAQSPEIGRIALYADSFRTVNELDLPAPYTSFDLYIFCQPSVNGTYCAEFAIGSTNESMIVAATEWHPELSIVLGDMTTGVSACLLECQTDWFWISKVTMLNSNIDPATIEIVRHPDVGYYQFASCLPGSPIEPVFFGPGLYVNSSYTPDTEPPVPASIDVEDGMHLSLQFDEKIFEPDAVDPASYLIYTTDGTEDTIPVGFAALQAEEDRVWMVLGEPLTVAPYTLELVGLRDIGGNPAAPGTGIAFMGQDTSPPELLSGSSSGAGIITLVFSETLSEASAQSISRYSIDCDGCPFSPQVSSAELQLDGITVRLTLTSALSLNVTYGVWVEGIEDISGNVMAGTSVVYVWAVDYMPPRVTGISLVTDTALDVFWNESLEESSAEDLSNYTFTKNGPPVEPMNLISAVLNGGNTVRLDFSPAIDPEESYTLYIREIVDKSGTPMLPDSFFIDPLDTIPPHMISAECNGLMLIELVFSEAIDDDIGGHTEYFQVYPAGSPETPVPLSDVDLYGGDVLVRLYLAEELAPDVEYTVNATGIRDAVGNVASLLQRNLTCDDIYPPEVEKIILPDYSHVQIQFDETVNMAAADPASYLLYPAADSAATVGIDTVTVHDMGMRVELTTAVPLSIGDMYTLRMIGIGDMSGNMIDPDSSWSFAALENVLPVLVNLTVTSDSIVHLEFNEPLDPVTAEDISNYAVLNTSGVTVPLPLRSASLDAAGTVIDLEIDGKASVGMIYVARIIGVKDLSGNELDMISEGFQFVDDIPPVLLSVAGISTRNIIAYFNEEITSASARVENNFTLHPAGDPATEVDVFQSERLYGGMSVNLLLGGDLVQDTDYILAVSGIEDLAGTVMEPDSLEFRFIDNSPPAILSAELVNSMRLSVSFNEPVDSVTASDPGIYAVYQTSSTSQRIDVNSIDWMTDEVRLDLAEEPVANVNYTLRIVGIEDRFDNVADELYASFTRVAYDPTAKIFLFADSDMSSQEVEVDLYQTFSIYVWVQPGESGVFAVEYALSQPETYIAVGTMPNPVYVSVTLGDPYTGHSLALALCAADWFWACRIDCFSNMVFDEQEIVWVLPHPDAGAVQIVSCLSGHPIEPVFQTYPLVINSEYVGTLLDRWDASFRSGGIELTWSILETESSPEFAVSRTPDGTAAWQPVGGGLIRGDGLEYSLLDQELEFGRSYRYRVECIEDDERKVLFETDAISTPVMPVALRQNSPNPFNPSTSIGFFLPQPGNVRLEIFDVNGRLIDVLANQHYTSGEHSIDWNGTDRSGASVSSGVYFYRLTTGKESLSRKMVLLR
jgi:hypothetical protein